jgi:hypothetical protein
MSKLSSSVVVKKQPGETIQVSMEFTNWLDTGITISNPIVTSTAYGCDTSDLSITSVAVNGQFVDMLISGGTDRTRYRVQVQVNTSGGEVLQGDGILEVTDR